MIDADNLGWLVWAGGSRGRSTAGADISEMAVRRYQVEVAVGAVPADRPRRQQ